jgi:DNA-binding transcriptional ArsR family regulator
MWAVVRAPGTGSHFTRSTPESHPTHGAVDGDPKFSGMTDVVRNRPQPGCKLAIPSIRFDGVMKSITPLLKALAVPSRLALYTSLGSAGKPLGQAARDLGLAQSTVSYHAAVLRRVGLVVMVPRGREHWYRWSKQRWYLVQGHEEPEVPKSSG